MGHRMWGALKGAVDGGSPFGGEPRSRLGQSRSALFFPSKTWLLFVFFLFAYCGLVGNPHLTAKSIFFGSPSNINQANQAVALRTSGVDTLPETKTTVVCWLCSKAGSTEVIFSGRHFFRRNGSLEEGAINILGCGNQAQRASAYA